MHEQCGPGPFVGRGWVRGYLFSVLAAIDHRGGGGGGGVLEHPASTPLDTEDGTKTAAANQLQYICAWLLTL